MRTKVKAMVVDDHPLMSTATQMLLEQTGQIKVTHIAGTGQMCLEQLETEQVGLAVLDYQLPDQTGIQLAQQIRASYPNIKIVMFTSYDMSLLADVIVWELELEAVISKGTSEAMIQQMILCVLDDQVIFPKLLLAHLKSPQKKKLVVSALTDEDIAMMKMVIQGATHEAIAEHIHTSRRTVDNHLRKIYEKLGVDSKLQAIQKVLGDDYYSTFFKEGAS